MGDVSHAGTDRYYHDPDNPYAAKTGEVLDEQLRGWLRTCVDRVPVSARILEFGSGTGRDARFLMDLGYRVQTSDYSPVMVGFLHDAGFGDAVVIDVRDFDDRACWDVVLADAVFVHFDRPVLADVLSRVHACLVPSGRLAFTMKAADSPRVCEDRSGRFFRFTNRADIVDLCAGAGFSRVEVHSQYDHDTAQDWLHVVAFA